LLFNSFDFGLFLPVVFCLYWLVGSNRIKIQNFILLFASYFFYGIWDIRFLGLIFISSIIDFYASNYIEKAKKNNHKKLWLYISLSFNLGVLFFFKYYNFFLDNFKTLFSVDNESFSTLDIIVPVGLSFYTFQTIGYTIDVYRKKIKPSKNLLNFLCFVSFFPQLVAGPIERASKLLPQFTIQRAFSYRDSKDGLRQILWGLFKKIVVADNIGVAIYSIYEYPENYGSITLIYAALLFLLQLYADFSGYSDIAIGTAKLFGFKLSTNFNLPYLANSVTGFWRRWHITLSKWFQDYIYISFINNNSFIFISKSTKKIIGLFITMILIGFWHGAKWTYISFGISHSILIIIENITIKFKAKKIKIYQWLEQGNLLSKLYTIVFLVISLVFFRSSSIDRAIFMLKEIITQNIPFYSFNLILRKRMLFVIFMITIEVIYKKYEHPLKNIEVDLPKIIRWIFYYFLIFLIIRYGRPQEEFIYFQF